MPYFVALWTQPENDPEGFEEHYRTTHAEIVQRWPGFQGVQVIKTPSSPMGDPAYHIVTIVEVDDVQAALNSPEAKEAIDDAMALMEKHGNQLTALTGETF